MKKRFLSGDSVRQFTVFAALLAFGVGLTGCNGLFLKDQVAEEQATQTRIAQEKDMFFSMSQNFVKKRLSSSDSIKFPSSTEATMTKLTDNKYRVTSYFDLQKDNGKPVRSHYVCELTKISSAKWHCDSLQIQ